MTSHCRPRFPPLHSGNYKVSNLKSRVRIHGDHTCRFLRAVVGMRYTLDRSISLFPEPCHAARLFTLSYSLLQILNPQKKKVEGEGKVPKPFHASATATTCIYVLLPSPRSSRRDVQLRPSGLRTFRICSSIQAKAND